MGGDCEALMIHEFGHMVTEDFLRIMLGDKLSHGCYRDVYVFEPDPTKVIKIEHRSHSYSNFSEWDIWKACPKEFEKWFAPCRFLSAFGSVLIQDRVKHTDKLPSQIPAFFADTKKTNWGTLPNGRIVCCDYGNHKLFDRGFTKRMVKADFWE